MFRRDESGTIAVIFAIALPILLAGVAGAVELTRAEAFKQRLNSAVELSCSQAAIRVSNARAASVADSLKDYSSVVKDILVNNIRLKNVATTDYTAANPVVGPTATNIRLQVTGTINYIFSSYVPSTRTNSRFVVTRDCAIPAIPPPGSPQLVFQESFEYNHSVRSNSWDVLKNWNGWQTTNAGVEINGQPTLVGNNIINGFFFAELDSDCNTSANRGVSNCQSNSAMTRQVDMTAGNWEVRYSYLARHGYVNTTPYGTQPICSDQSKPQGPQRGDFASQASKNQYIKAAQNDGETFRIEVYLDTSSTNLFQSANLIDACIWADTWLVRVIKLKITTAGTYYISWKAAGRQDTYGGLIDDIRICREECT